MSTHERERPRSKRQRKSRPDGFLILWRETLWHGGHCECCYVVFKVEIIDTSDHGSFKTALYPERGLRLGSPKVQDTRTRKLEGTIFECKPAPISVQLNQKLR